MNAGNGDVLRIVRPRETRRGVEVSLEVFQDCGDLIERCAAARNADILRGYQKPRTFRLVAELPVALVEVLAVRGVDVIGDREARRKVLNDPAFRAFRTTNGKV